MRTSILAALAAAAFSPSVALACTGGTVLWDEAAQGDLPGDENNPYFLQNLAAGTYVLCGRVDPRQDTITLGLPTGVRITGAQMDVSGFQSLGQNGFSRFFRPVPAFSVYSSATHAADGTYSLDTSGFDGQPIVGFTAASVGPSGALYDYKLTLTVEGPPPCDGGTVLWDEAAQGDLPGDENNPFFLEDLAPGTYVLCGTVDPFQDTVTMGLPPGIFVSDAQMEVYGYRSLGQDGFSRFFSPPPAFGVYSSATHTGDGTYSLDTSGFSGRPIVGFTAASVGPSGATYGYKLTVTVDGPPPCTGANILWDEAVSGDLQGDENAPQFLQDLAPGSYTICGSVDPFQDTITVGLPYGRKVRFAGVDVWGYQSLGQDGFVRFFRPQPFFVWESAFFVTDGYYPLDTLSFANQPVVGFTAASVGPSGAIYWWTLDLDVIAGPTVSAASTPVAGSPVTFQATGMTPGGATVLIASLTPGSTAVPGCPGLTAELRAPNVLGTGAANAAGTSSYRVNLPRALAGRTVYLQAFDRTTCTLSPVATYRL